MTKVSVWIDLFDTNNDELSSESRTSSRFIFIPIKYNLPITKKRKLNDVFLSFKNNEINGLYCLRRCWENELIFCAPRTSSSSNGNLITLKSS